LPAASGRLSLDLRYRINNNVIEGDNQAVFEQLMLGEKVQSPDAFDLPIELAVSLLKDDQGRIDIAIPVSGSLDDPQFDYGTLIRKAIGNVISRIISAPFRALASLFGGSKEGEDIGAITFEPGQSRLLPPEREKIQRIAQGLGKRPEIRVTVPGRADSEVDGSRLKREALAREISRRAGFEVSDDESAGGISIEDSRTRAAIRDLYAERLTPAELDKQRAQAEAAASEGKAEKPAVLDRLRNLATGEPQVTNPRPFYNGLMRRLRETQTLPATALDQLAQARAQAIALGLRDAGVAENRIGTSVAAPTADAKAKDVKVELALEKK
jgi:outer membrane protein OmpA-like peptidoglycan-associated protein